MLQTLYKLIGYKPTDFKQLVASGALIVDVRTKGEFSTGHLKGSINIPLDALSGNMKKLDKKTPVIVCCASGMRSASAKSMLVSKGYSAFNGGGWSSLGRKLSK